MKLKVFGSIVPVKKLDLSKSDNDGHYNVKEQSIKIHNKLSKYEFNRILCHELVHVVCDRLGLHNAQLSCDLEEILADNIATAICENADLKWKQHK